MGDQQVSLVTGFRNERIALPHDADNVVGATLEPEFAYVIVEEAAPDARNKILARRETHEVTPHRARQRASDAQPG
jgi:hypothetical protein